MVQMMIGERPTVSLMRFDKADGSEGLRWAKKGVKAIWRVSQEGCLRHSTGLDLLDAFIPFAVEAKHFPTGAFEGGYAIA